MNDELEKLRPEVREAVGIADNWAQDYQHSFQAERNWDIIRAELLRLADECATLKAQSIYPRAELLANFAAANERAEKAESELAALKARIRGACLVPLTAVMLRDGYSLTVSGPMSVNDVDELAGKCVRLVVEE